MASDFEMDMGFSLNDIASCFCKDDCKDGKGKNNIILLIVIILVICGCSGKGSFPIGGFIPCRPRGCNGTGDKSGGSWIIIAIILLCLCGNNGLGGLGGESGNLNTNIINLNREDYEDDY